MSKKVVKKKSLTSDKEYLNEKQLSEVNSFYQKIDALNKDILIKQKDMEILKIKRLVSEMQGKLFSAELVNSNHGLQQLQQKKSDITGSEREELLRRIAKELGINATIKGFDPVSGEIDY